MQVFQWRISGCLHLELSLRRIQTNEAGSHVRSSERPRNEAMVRGHDDGVVPAALNRTSRRVHLDGAVERLGKADNELRRGPSVDNGHEARNIPVLYAPPSETEDNLHLFEIEEELEDPLHFLSNAFIKAAVRLGERNCNDLLRTMRSVSDRLLTFLLRCLNIAEMRHHKSATLITALKRNDFEKRTATCGKILTYMLLVRNCVHVLQIQVARPPSSDILTSYGAVRCFCHPLNLKIGIEAGAAVEHYVKCQRDPDICWKERERDYVQSAVGCAQLFENKSQILLRAGSLVFYPLDWTGLTFNEDVHPHLITNGHTVFA